MRSEPALPLLPLLACLACSGSDTGESVAPNALPAPEAAEPVSAAPTDVRTPLRQQVVISVTGMS